MVVDKVFTEEKRAELSDEIKKERKARKTKIKKCLWCGNMFETSSATKKTCSDDCRLAYTKSERDKKKEELKEKEQTKQANSLVEVAKEARAHGMSYGQYVAWKSFQENRR